MTLPGMLDRTAVRQSETSAMTEQWDDERHWRGSYTGVRLAITSVVYL
jgi:hypothetical protein